MDSKIAGLAKAGIGDGEESTANKVCDDYSAFDLIHLPVPPSSFPRRREPILAVAMDKQPCVYILASNPNGTLYIGVTSNLPHRVAQHKAGGIDGFAKRYGVDKLVWYEPHETMESAITREKQMKKWNWRWKTRLIARRNPRWKDLSGEIL